MKKKEHCFSPNKHIGVVEIFLDKNLESLETSLNNFFERKDIDICLLLCSDDVSTL